MLRARLIPVLQLLHGALVKTVQFRHPAYIGDPVNTVRIFNELEVDELCFLDIRATREARPPDFSLLRQLSEEAFCPVAYGGGIRSLDDAARVFAAGFEKVVLNTAACNNPELLTAIAAKFGSQAVVASLDVKRDLLGRHRVLAGGKAKKVQPLVLAQQLEAAGAGELLLTAVDREGMWCGYDLDLTGQISAAVSIPVVAHGGAGDVYHVEAVLRQGASAAGVGSLVLYQKKGAGVLINVPETALLEQAISRSFSPPSAL